MRPANWQHMAKIVLDEHGHQLGGWDRNFLESFEKGRFMAPTPRQLDTFGRIARRFVIEFPAEGELIFCGNMPHRWR